MNQHLCLCTSSIVRTSIIGQIKKLAIGAIHYPYSIFIHLHNRIILFLSIAVQHTSSITTLEKQNLKSKSNFKLEEAKRILKINSNKNIRFFIIFSH